MASVSALSGTQANDLSIGTVACNVPSRCAVFDSQTGNWAFGAAPAVGSYLKTTGYGFTVPFDATITGVKCQINCFRSGGLGQVIYGSVRLVKGGTIQGSDLGGSSITAGSQQPEGVFDEFGADGQMWGLSLTPDDVTDPLFGFVWGPSQTNSSSRSALCNYVQMTVYYSGGTTVPVNTVAPAISGANAVGYTVSCSTGTWSGGGTITYTYQWQRDDLGSGSYSDIASATSPSYTLVSADDLCHVRCAVTATNAGGVGTADSNSILVFTPTLHRLFIAQP